MVTNPDHGRYLLRSMCLLAAVWCISIDTHSLASHYYNGPIGESGLYGDSDGACSEGFKWLDELLGDASRAFEPAAVSLGGTLDSLFFFFSSFEDSFLAGVDDFDDSAFGGSSFATSVVVDDDSGFVESTFAGSAFVDSVSVDSTFVIVDSGFIGSVFFDSAIVGSVFVDSDFAVSGLVVSGFFSFDFVDSDRAGSDFVGSAFDDSAFFGSIFTGFDCSRSCSGVVLPLFMT